MTYSSFKEKKLKVMSPVFGDAIIAAHLLMIAKPVIFPKKIALEPLTIVGQKLFKHFGPHICNNL